MLSKLSLQPWQVAHVAQITQFLMTNSIYLDKSPTGSGKTYATLHIAKSFDLQLIIICPLVMVDKWTDLADQLGVRVVAVMGYSQLAGRDDHVSHPYLLVNDGEYRASPDLIRILEANPTGVVVDEIQYCKNIKSARTKAVTALMKAVVEADGVCRGMLLSATPFDKEDHAESMLKMLGFILDTPYEIDPFRLTGANYAYERCLEIDRVTTLRIPLPTSKPEYLRFCYQLFRDVVVQHTTFIMDAPTHAFPHDIKNGFYHMEEEDSVLLAEGERMINEAISEMKRGDPEPESEPEEPEARPGGAMGKIVKALIKIERSKIGILLRLARERLAEPHSKVIIAMHYILDMKYVKQELDQTTRTELLYGSTKKDVRTRVIRKFQEPNDDLRVLVINPASIGVGIDLDDTDGHYPRYVYIVPSYRMDEIQQTAGRVYRVMTKSQPHTRVIYGHGYRAEAAILRNLSAKSRVVREITGSDDISLFPGEYPAEQVGE